jgi:antitoxin component YwqK of YwqJK toxin-antitoxin module
VQEKATEGGESQTSNGPPPTGELRGDRAEQERLRRENEAMEQELLERSQSHAPPSRIAVGGRGSIAEELARLESQVARAPESTPSPRPGPLGLPRETVDRNADGQPDLWVYYEGSQLSREVFDENHDGRADRILHYNEGVKLARSEEDLDGDGGMETFSIYREGELIRKRSDSNGDGQSDSWSFYRGGDLARHELDRNGDGFRDMVLVYQSGQLVREEEDRDGDGRPDIVTRYQNGELAERHEDIDYDGTPDVASFYESGKLVRRELSSAESLGQWTNDDP